MGKTPKQLCRLICPELGSFELRPGQSLRIGRHQDNDIHAPATMISRFHARFDWDERVPRPVVFDNGSQNGTRVDGKKVRTATPLSHESRVSIGEYVFRVELEGAGDEEDQAAILKDTGDMVTLFSDEGPDVDGSLGSPTETREVLLRVERERRTGTLFFRLNQLGKCKVTYCLGRIMAVDTPDGMGLRGLERLLRSPGGTYRFTSELEPQEDSLNLWISDYLRSRNLGPESPATERFRATQRLRRP